MKIKLEDLRKAANEILIQVGIKKDISKFDRLALEDLIHYCEIHEDFDDETLTEETQSIVRGLADGNVGYDEEKDLTRFN